MELQKLQNEIIRIRSYALELQETETRILEDCWEKTVSERLQNSLYALHLGVSVLTIWDLEKQLHAQKKDLYDVSLFKEEYAVVFPILGWNTKELTKESRKVQWSVTYVVFLSSSCLIFSSSHVNRIFDAASVYLLLDKYKTQLGGANIDCEKHARDFFGPFKAQERKSQNTLFYYYKPKECIEFFQKVLAEAKKDRKTIPELKHYERASESPEEGDDTSKDQPLNSPQKEPPKKSDNTTEPDKPEKQPEQQPQQAPPVAKKTDAAPPATKKQPPPTGNIQKDTTTTAKVPNTRSNTGKGSQSAPEKGTTKSGSQPAKKKRKTAPRDRSAAESAQEDDDASRDMFWFFNKVMDIHHEMYGWSLGISTHKTKRAKERAILNVEIYNDLPVKKTQKSELQKALTAEADARSDGKFPGVMHVFESALYQMLSEFEDIQQYMEHKEEGWTLNTSHHIYDKFQETLSLDFKERSAPEDEAAEEQEQPTGSQPFKRLKKRKAASVEDEAVAAMTELAEGQESVGETEVSIRVRGPSDKAADTSVEEANMSIESVME